MNARRRAKLLEGVAPLLEAGEQVQISTLATVGSVSMKKKMLTAAVAGIASGGLLTVNVRPRPMYTVLTDRRILFFDSTSTGGPGKHMATLSRSVVTISGLKKAQFGLAVVTQLSVANQERGIRVLFPAASKAAGREFAAALPLTQE